MSSGLLTSRQLQELLQISRATFYRWLDAGKLPQPIKLTDRSFRWRAEDVDEWLASRNCA